MLACCCAAQDGPATEVVQIHPTVAVPGPESAVDSQKGDVYGEDPFHAEGLATVPAPDPKVDEAKGNILQPPEVEEPPPQVQEPEPMPAPAAAEPAEVAAPEAPAAWGSTARRGVTEWQATLDKGVQDMSLGVDIRIAKTHLVTQAVNDGLVKTYNDANPSTAIKPGTVIMEVNGASGDSQHIYDAVRSSRLLQVKLRFVSEFSLTVPKDGPLGLDCKRSVMEVKLLKKEGIIPTYNKTCEPGYEVNIGDRIVAVNGQYLDPEKLLNAITQVKGSLTLAIVRP